MLTSLFDMQGPYVVSAGLAIILVLVLSLSLHEFGHAFAAYKQGDLTPKVNGRVTLNPLAHIDPIGFICCCFFCFGWAKPVEVNSFNFRNYKKGMVLTSIAGVIVNLILAVVGCGLYFVCLRFLPITSGLNAFVAYFFYYLYILNIGLFIFNLLPICPLDGFNCIAAVTKYDNKFVNFMRKYGSIILILILIFGDVLLIRLLSWVAWPIETLWGLIIF